MVTCRVGVAWTTTGLTEWRTIQRLISTQLIVSCQGVARIFWRAASQAAIEPTYTTLAEAEMSLFGRSSLDRRNTPYWP